MSELTKQSQNIYEVKRDLEESLALLSELKEGAVRVTVQGSLSKSITFTRDDFKDGFIEQKESDIQEELQEIEERIYRSRKILEGYNGKS